MSILLAVADETNDWVQEVAEVFRRELPEHQLVLPDELFDRRSVSYAVAWRHKPGSLANFPMLEAVFSLGAGVDFLLADERLPDVSIFRIAQDNLTFRMSEYVVLQCLTHLRDQRRYDRQQRDHWWNVGDVPPIASEVRVGIMGMGVLGQDAAMKLKVMGFDVAGWSRSPKTMDDVPVFSGADGLEDFLARTDILVVLLPLTNETRGILNMALFEKLARGGRFNGPVMVNAGRGGLQVEADIFRALDHGILKAASLDVFETEPLPTESPLWAHPQIMLTPHIAADSEPFATARFIIRQIRDIEAGREPPGRVDRSLGY